MASTTFTAGTVIPSTWLNDVNALVYGSASSPAASPIKVDTSGNVFIGTTSSAHKLRVVSSDANYTAKIENTRGDPTGYGLWVDTRWNSTANIVARFSTNSGTIDVLTLFGDQTTVFTGKMGFGSLPSSGWRSSVFAIQLGTFPSLWQQANGAANYGFGVYEGGTNTFNYATTGDAPTLYSQISGRHIWYNAASGTANASISFTKVLELDASGNLLARLNSSAPTLVDNSTMTFTLTSNTNLRISVRGSDGVTRTANITLA